MQWDDTAHRARRHTAIAVSVLAALAATAAAGHADRKAPSPDRAVTAPSDTTTSGPAGSPADRWRGECGACHLLYPPRLLPARSWRAIMGGLDRHFGADASLDPAVAAEVASFLERNAGRDPRGASAALRITETPWFRSEHRKIPAAVWERPAVKGPANCAACHPAAERGHFDDDAVTVPR